MASALPIPLSASVLAIDAESEVSRLTLHGYPAEELTRVLAIPHETAHHIYADIEAKRRATGYLHQVPLLLGDVPEAES